MIPSIRDDLPSSDRTLFTILLFYLCNVIVIIDWKMVVERVKLDRGFSRNRKSSATHRVGPQLSPDCETDEDIELSDRSSCGSMPFIEIRRAIIDETFFARSFAMEPYLFAGLIGPPRGSHDPPELIEAERAARLQKERERLSRRITLSARYAAMKNNIIKSWEGRAKHSE